MWSIVSIVAGVVAILLLFQLLDVSDSLTKRLKGRLTNREIEERFKVLEARMAELERKSPQA